MQLTSHLISALSVGLATFVLGCATPSPSPEPSTSQHHIHTDRVTLVTPKGALGGAVRFLGENTLGGFVVMNGVEERAVESAQFRSASYSAIAEELAEQADCRVAVNAGYFFIYPEGYESLQAIELRGQLDPRFQDIQVTLVLGADTALYTAFALLGHTLGVSLVADNAVAEASCGELNLAEVSLLDALEAILKSARVPLETIRIEQTADYVFFQSALTEAPAGTMLMNANRLSPEQRAALDRKVNLVLPQSQGDRQRFERYLGGQPLGSVLRPLSNQLGIRVNIAASLARLPVNPMVLNGVSAQDAMDLLIRQWPTDDFGYTMTSEGILIQPRNGAES